MPIQSFVVEVEIPTVEQFQERYPQYGAFAKDEGADLFSMIMCPESFMRAKIATELKLPAVAGIAEKCAQGVILTRHIKQYIGALTCCLMEANGYRKDKDKAIPHPAFSKGKFYRKDD